MEEVVVVEDVEFGGREWEPVLGRRWAVEVEPEEACFDFAVVFRNSDGGILVESSAQYHTTEERAYFGRSMDVCNQPGVLKALMSVGSSAKPLARDTLQSAHLAIPVIVRE